MGMGGGAGGGMGGGGMSALGNLRGGPRGDRDGSQRP